MPYLATYQTTRLLAGAAGRYLQLHSRMPAEIGHKRFG